MKTIKFYPSDRKKITLDGKKYKGYTISDIPNDFGCKGDTWFNYKGLSFIPE